MLAANERGEARYVQRFKATLRRRGGSDPPSVHRLRDSFQLMSAKVFVLEMTRCEGVSTGID